MTPERKVWWDSLPTEEKRVRIAIAWQEGELYDHKLLLNNKNFAPLNPWQVKLAIKCIKRAIKSLRKQIAIKPLRKEFGLFCLTCKDCLGVGWLHIVKTPHCSQCGQKLRWE